VGRLLAARLGAASQPGIGYRGRAEFRLRQLQQTGGEGIGHGADRLADLIRGGIAGDQGDLQLRELGADRDQGCQVPCLMDIPRQIDRIGTLEAYQVGSGYNPDHPAPVQYRQMVYVEPGHGDQDLRICLRSLSQSDFDPEEKR